MLTLNQIIKLYQIGVELKFRKGGDIHLGSGGYDPSSLEIMVYTSNIESIKERDITVLHEFIHARDDNLKPSRVYDERPDEEVEDEAVKTYNNKPEILKFLRLIYAF